MTRRALLAAAGVTLVAGLAARKLLTGPGVAPPAEPGPPRVELRPLTSVVAVSPPAVPPPLILRTLDGTHVTLAAYAGRPTVLNFWATWCVPCVAELPELDRLAAAGAVNVLAVSADRGGAATVRPFLAAHAVAHATILLDPGSDAVHALQVAGFPTTFLLGPDGHIHGMLEGPAAWSGAGAKIEQLTR